MTKALTVDIKVKDMDIFQNLIKIMKEFIEDERISEDIRQHYMDEIKSIVDSDSVIDPRD
jgi:hypothetical protein